jgi:hypothetical protein
MSVIGRLDKGVEALLINPLKERQTSAQEQHKGSTLPAPPAEEREPETAREKREADYRLPVWLL